MAFAYDADGLLIKAGDLTLSRDIGNGLVTGTVLGGIGDTRGYNGFGELANRSVAAAGAQTYQVGYTRDPLGRITEQTEVVGTAPATALAYSYDVAGRLTEVWRNGVAVESYAYDANSNRASKATPSGTTTYTYDAQDRLLAATGPGGVTTYAYTEAGDLRSKSTATGITTYDYDAVGNLRAVQRASGTQIAYLIDGQDRRIGKQVNGVQVQGWLYRDQLNPIVELDGQGHVIARFVYADHPNVPAYMVKNGVTYRIVSDHLGSPRLVIDTATGAIVQRMDYDAFGSVVTDTNPGFQPFGFAGGLYDLDTGLVRFGARDYDPESGRWTAKDPIRFKSGDTNIYSYSGSNPINFVDPSGLRAYSHCETRAFLDQARQDMSGWDKLLNALRNHGAGGKFDFKINQPADTFTLGGQTLTAAEFGNFIAGYSGEYFGFGGYEGVRAGGILFDYIDGARNWDLDSVDMIDSGANRANAERRGWMEPPCVCPK